jgi:hypothetical protein
LLVIGFLHNGGLETKDYSFVVLYHTQSKCSQVLFRYVKNEISSFSELFIKLEIKPLKKNVLLKKSNLCMTSLLKGALGELESLAQGQAK